MIRQLNRRMDRATRREAEYDELIRELLAQDQSGAPRLRAGAAASRPLRLGRATRPSSWIEWVKHSGIHVVGDVDELRPQPLPEDEPYVNPDKVPARGAARRSSGRARRR